MLSHIDMDDDEFEMHISDDVLLMSTNPNDHVWIEAQQELHSKSSYSVIEGCIRQSVGAPIEQTKHDHS